MEMAHVARLFCVVLASTSGENGLGKECQINVAVCFHASEKVWVWLQPGKNT